MISKGTESNMILVTGVTRLWAGCLSVADGLAKRGIKTIYFYTETHKRYAPSHALQHRVIIASGFFGINWAKFFGVLLTTRPSHVEFYHHGSSFIALGQLMILRLLRIPVVVVCTGGEILYWDNHSWLRRAVIKLSFKLAKAIVTKELYMKEYMSRYSMGGVGKAVEIHNSIVIKDEPSFKKPSKTGLFLNSFKKWRNAELIIHAAAIVRRKIPDVQFDLVGLTGRKIESTYTALAAELGLENVIRFHKFTTETAYFFDRASVYLLPADIVFCNNSLLEAMERGIPPVVANVPGAEAIVENGVSGYLVNRNKDELAAALLRLFQDEEHREAMGRAARTRVIAEFDEEKRTSRLMRMYHEQVWNSPHEESRLG